MLDLDLDRERYEEALDLVSSFEPDITTYDHQFRLVLAERSMRRAGWDPDRALGNWTEDVAPYGVRELGRGWWGAKGTDPKALGAILSLALSVEKFPEVQEYALYMRFFERSRQGENMILELMPPEDWPWWAKGDLATFGRYLPSTSTSPTAA